MKKIKKILCVLFTSFLLTGCFKTEMTFDVKSVDDMTVGVTMLLSPELLAESEEDLVGSLKEDYENSESTIEFEIKEVEETINDVVWKGVSMTGKVPAEEIKKYLKVEDDKLIFTLTEEASNELMGESESEEASMVNTEDLTEEMIAMYKSAGVSMKVKITMPNEPTTNIGVVEGNTVTIDMLSQEYTSLKEPIVISCDDPDAAFPVMPLVALLAIFIIGAAIIIFILKKPTKTEYDTFEEQTFNV